MEVKAKDVVIFAAIILGLVGTIVGAAGLYVANQAGNHDAAISLYISDPDNSEWILEHIGVLNDKLAILWLNQNFVSEGEFAGHNSILNKTLDAMVEDLEAAGLAVTTLQNKFIIIEHTTIPPTTPDSTAKCAGDFSLKTIGIDGVEKNSFSMNKPVYIRGNYATIGAQYDYQILKAGSSEVIRSNVGFVESDSIVLGIFNIAGDRVAGSYTAEFKIKGVTDCISFTIVP